MRMTIVSIAAGTLVLVACSDEACPSGAAQDSGVCADSSAVAADDAGLEDVDGGYAADASSDASGRDAGRICENDDSIDDEGFDRNCDGVDGIRDSYLFVSLTGDDGSAGTPSSPLRSLSAALKRAVVERKEGVLVAQGTYEECDIDLELSFVRVFGGYTADWSSRDVTAPSVLLTSSRGLRVYGLQPLKPSHVGGMRIQAASADEPEFCAPEAPLEPAARSSVALTLSSDGSTPLPVTLRHVQLQAGMGGDGAAGADGPHGADGARGRDGCPGGSGCGAIPVNAFSYAYPDTLRPDETNCGDRRVRSGHGGGAEVGGGNGRGTPGGLGEVPGGVVGSGLGASGDRGSMGEHGAGGARLGDFTGDAEAYSPYRAASGAAGQAGQGGGGGGATNQPPVVNTCPSSSGARYVSVEGTITFGSGGSGGTGGCGGDGGEGGQGGGASVGVVLWRVSLTLENASVRAEEGGRGGRGGRGGAGGVGGSGGAGGIEVCSPYTNGRFYRTTPAGRGGSGGSGGDGGDGGGGMGGPSVGALLFDLSEIHISEALGSSVEAGAPGLGGPSGGLTGVAGPAESVVSQ